MEGHFDESCEDGAPEAVKVETVTGMEQLSQIKCRQLQGWSTPSRKATTVTGMDHMEHPGHKKC